MTEQTFAATRDTFIRGTQGDTNFEGNGLEVRVVIFGGSKTLWGRTLIEFDVSALIGQYVSIDAAQLELNVYLNDGNASGAKVVRVKRENKPWTETGATWNKHNGVDPWHGAGCDGANDKDTTTPTQVSWTCPTANGWKTITGLAAFITDAIANRSNIVSLLLYLDDESDTGSSRGLSNARDDEYTIDTALRPILRVTYTPSGGGAGGIGDRRRLVRSLP